MISYDVLWKTMKEKGVSQYTLIKDYGVSSGQLDRIRHDRNVSTHTLNYLCAILHCNVDQVCRYIPDDEA